MGPLVLLSVTDKIAVNYSVKKSLLALGRLGFKDYPGNFELNLGGTYTLLEKNSVKKTRVILNREYAGTYTTTNYKGQTVSSRVETITYTVIPAKRYTAIGARGGYYMKRGAFGFGNEASDRGLDTPIDETALTSVGLYAGLFKRSIKNVFIETKDYGVQYNSIGDDISFDLLLVPVNNFSDLNNESADVTEPIKTVLGNSPIGFRIGWTRYQVEKKSRTGKKFGGSKSFEVGLKPFQGLFFNAAWAITLVKQ